MVAPLLFLLFLYLNNQIVTFSFSGVCHLYGNALDNGVISDTLQLQANSTGKDAESCL